MKLEFFQNDLLTFGVGGIINPQINIANTFTVTTDHSSIFSHCITVEQLLYF